MQDEADLFSYKEYRYVRAGLEAEGSDLGVLSKDHGRRSGRGKGALVGIERDLRMEGEACLAPRARW